jgi:hypothetical protein
MTINTPDERQARRIDADRGELAERIARAVPGDGLADPQPGLNLARFARPTELHHGFLDPCFCVIAQGAKTLTLGEDVFRYDPARYMIATVGLPMTAQVVEASPDRPYLSLRLDLDPSWDGVDEAWEFYDYSPVGWERTNEYDDPAHARTIARMKQALEAFDRCATFVGDDTLPPRCRGIDREVGH